MFIVFANLFLLLFRRVDGYSEEQYQIYGHWLSQPPDYL
jgi:hypothetical protein